ncbi:MAG: hypothetical protein WD577_09085 [Bacteroidales bacterium]
MMDRKQFIQSGIIGLSGMFALPVFALKNSMITDPIPLATVEEFVKAGHNDLEKVKAMLEEIPNLIYARHDWGNGDFEEAIEGAGHVGNKEIANYLIEKGARVNLFVLTMLGQFNLVKPTLKAYPKLIHAKGPHGFTMLHHAKIGGEASKGLYEWLIENGLKETKVKM